MTNPFVVSSPQGYKYIDSKCSLNKMVIAKLPIEGLDDSIQGKPVSEIFSTAVITEKVVEERENLKIPPSTPKEKLPFLLMQSMNSTDNQVRATATNIAKLFGTRLGLILLTLKTALPQNRAARPEWENCHWEYWQNLKTIIMVGGLTQGKFGIELVESAKKTCILNGEPAYNLIAFENAAYVGVMGCARVLKSDDGVNILMDFGQTNMKRSIVTRSNREIVSIENLPLIHSKYMQWDISDAVEKQNQAKLLHRHIMNAVVDAYNQAQKMGDVGSEIVISIASYTHNGVLDSNRGGYAKLSVLYKNYGEYLSEELSSVLKRPVEVTLIHDGTAVALNFIKYPSSVCVTLGTFFGVGFTDIWN